MPSTGAEVGILPYSVTMAQTGNVKSETADYEGVFFRVPKSLEAQPAL